MFSKVSVYRILCVVFLLFKSTLGYLGQECTTPKNISGSCKFLEECQSIYELYQERPLSQKNIEYIRKSACNRDRNSGKAVVCCPPVLGNRGNTISLLPDWKTCGQDTIDKVAFGVETTIGEYPWLAMLEYTRRNGKKSYNCGGSLINSRYVLTAAHCISSSLGKPTAVRLGEHDTTTNPDCIDKYCAPNPKDFGIESTKINELYKSAIDNPEDIALIRLDRNVEYSTYIHPVCLPFTNPLMRSKNYEGTEMIVAGWGQTENGEPSSKKLKANIEVRDRNVCINYLQRSNIKLSDKQFCAGGLLGKDSCQGDSGGPLMVLESNSERRKSWYLWGIVSLGGRVCGQSSVPGIYVKVDKYEDWILRNIEA